MRARHNPFYLASKLSPHPRSLSIAAARELAIPGDPEEARFEWHNKRLTAALESTSSHLEQMKAEAARWNALCARCADMTVAEQIAFVESGEFDAFMFAPPPTKKERTL